MKEGFTIIEQIKLPSDYNALVDVENLVDRVCNGLGVQDEAYGNVLIAVTEAVNNAIQHGNELKKELFVDVSVGDKTEEFCFSVKDEGRGFDFNGLPDPTAPENLLKEGGRGIFLMKNLSDDLIYNSSGNSVSIYFVK
ncbi:MAG: ATP-binding protein [Crocinitomicaceae bacterium]|jgi:serine/threonine-protein kinase RsbW